ncbi:uncharacterized protein AMSG_08949 [Thecamonas trahens ATCC 50062]|uniref:Stc1 domain-containing protein n=1 Tax=Thecamonas trahens ATCC 50062 TaxID=461836 RepID=A0A0L0DMA4_THETB|nr:hypothetical protein AMSG_08949 [Thecamonas trahens ATCC 50062]KNC53442.1 hypothetical protein AMSG_08949 [Thecamonas trahens ATCC 50062]|eukprot:XP_013754477.1 hypothetical protein AMSG_08949 [Thecamonas trahens ATCC 50062]
MSSTSASHRCMACGVDLERGAYSKRQWSKGSGFGRCTGCVAAGLASPTAVLDHMAQRATLKAAEAEAAALRTAGSSGVATENRSADEAQEAADVRAAVATARAEQRAGGGHVGA